MKKRILSSMCSTVVFLSCIVPTLPSMSVAADESILPADVSIAAPSDEAAMLRTSSTDDDLLYNYMLQQSGVKPKSDGMRNGIDISYESGITAGAKLTGNNAAAYAYVKTQVEAIAAGTRTSTAIQIPFSELGIKTGPWSAEELGVDSIVSGNSISDAAVNSLYDKISLDFHGILVALLADCPYEFYWCDKTSYQTNSGGGCRAAYEDGEYKLYLTGTPLLKLYVSTDYSVDGAAKTTELPDTVPSAVNTAISNAQVITDYLSKDRSGKNLLAAYRDMICILTTYDYDAPGGQKPYGDPWQLIYVFDNDPETKVVCEGYAKAFKYLCDLSGDNLPGVSCMIASGTLGNGNHMWNVVNMEDNRSYLVDITQCDAMDAYVEENSVAPKAHTDTFFLSVPSSGTYNTTYLFNSPEFNFTYQGYSYTSPAQTYSYTYSSDTLGCYDSKYLRLSTTPYVTYTYVPAVAATCETDGNIAYYIGEDGKYYVLDANGSYIEKTRNDVIVPKSGHDWNPPTYTWNDLDSVTAKRVCKNDASHVETETAAVSSEVLTPASYTSKGWTRYTATFNNSSFTSQTKDVQDIPMLVGTEVVIEVSDINGIRTSSTVYAETFSTFNLPEKYMDGYNFIGWTVNGTLYTSKSAAQAALVSIVRAKPADPVKVAVKYEKINASYSVSVVNGKISTGRTSGTVQVSKLVTVKANTVSGKQFSHWIRNGKKVSTNSTYSFYMPSENVELTAVFTEIPIEQVGTAIIESVKVNESKLSFVSVLNIPKNCKFVKGGLVATSNNSIGENVNANNAEYVKLSAKATANTKNLKYTWTKSVSGNTVVYVKAYLVYKDSSGVEHTIYSDCVKANSSGIIY